MNIRYKGEFGTVEEEVYSNEYNLPNLMETWIYTGYHKPGVNEEVYLSSCNIPYHDNYRDSWTVKPNNDEYFSKVIIELVDYDDSNYDSAKCSDGGKYLDSTWIIREIKETITFGEYCQ